MNRLLQSLLVLLAIAIQGRSASGVAPAQVSLSTNVYNSRTGFGGLLSGSQIVFWDEFDGPNMDSVAFMQRRSGSGHLYADLIGGDATATNFFEMGGGSIHLTNAESDGVKAFYLAVSNNSANPWNYWGMKARIILGPGSTFSKPIIINEDNAQVSGDFLHAQFNINGDITLQRGIAECILCVTKTSLISGEPVIFEVFAFTNGVAVRRNDIYQRAWTTNTAWARQTVSIWEIFGVGVGRALYGAQIESIWAGYMSPTDALQMKQPCNIVTNLPSGVGMYTNEHPFSLYGDCDAYVGVGLHAAAGFTNWLRDAKLFPGRELTLADISGTAAGTNLWFACIEQGQTVGIPGRATARTNITADFTSYTAKSDGSNWLLIGKSP